MHKIKKVCAIGDTEVRKQSDGRRRQVWALFALQKMEKAFRHVRRHGVVFICILWWKRCHPVLQSIIRYVAEWSHGLKLVFLERTDNSCRNSEVLALSWPGTVLKMISPVCNWCQWSHKRKMGSMWCYEQSKMQRGKPWVAFVCVCVGTCFFKINTMLVSWSKISKFYINEKLLTTFCFVSRKVLTALWFLSQKAST